MEIYYTGPDSIFLVNFTSWLLPFPRFPKDIKVSYTKKKIQRAAIKALKRASSSRGSHIAYSLIIANLCVLFDFWLDINQSSPDHALPPKMEYKFLVTNKRECDRLAWRDVYYRDTECQVCHTKGIHHTPPPITVCHLTVYSEAEPSTNHNPDRGRQENCCVLLLLCLVSV